MKRRILWRYEATVRYHVVTLTDRPGYSVLDTQTSRTIGPYEPRLLAAARRAHELARPPPPTT